MEEQMKIPLIILLTIIGIALIGYAGGPFAISEDDLTNTGMKTEVVINPGDAYDSFSHFYIEGNKFNFTITEQNKSYSSPKIFFMLDDSPVIYDSFQDILEGTHTIKKYQMIIINSQTQINLQKWQKTYDIVIKTVIENKTIYVANQTFYVDKPINVTVTKYVNQTIEKIVTVEPDINAYLKKYQMYLIAIVGIGLVYYLTRVRKK